MSRRRRVVESSSDQLETSEPIAPKWQTKPVKEWNVNDTNKWIKSLNIDKYKKKIIADAFYKGNRDGAYLCRISCGMKVANDDLSISGAITFPLGNLIYKEVQNIKKEQKKHNNKKRKILTKNKSQIKDNNIHSPDAKRRKIDPNSGQINEGYDTEIFVNQTEANRYLCIICHCVYKNPYNIGCDDEHIFCKACLDAYFINWEYAAKSCPSCQGKRLFKNNIKPSKSIRRLVNSLKVKCPLQLQQNDNANKCIWNGELCDLDVHVNRKCSLGRVTCIHCHNNMKRFQQPKHEYVCAEKRVPCNLKCRMDIKRKLMARHQDYKCPMKLLSCDDCKENILRKNMEQHLLIECTEYEIMCSFKQYGCNDRIKRRLMDNHLKEKEIQHLKMKVNTIENELVRVKEVSVDQETRIRYLEKMIISDEDDDSSSSSSD